MPSRTTPLRGRNRTSAPPPATRSPLRGPGQEAPTWNIIPLTFRWDIPLRSEYFDRVIREELDGVEEFYFLGRGGYYAEQLGEWIDVTWPDTFARSERSFGLVSRIRFQKRSNR